MFSCLKMNLLKVSHIYVAYLYYNVVSFFYILKTLVSEAASAMLRGRKNRGDTVSFKIGKHLY